MVISGGFNRYPSDLKAVLREHPDVPDVAVVGVPSSEWGETPVAWVVPAPEPPAPEELRVLAKSDLEGHSVLPAFVMLRSFLAATSARS
jgi:long-chain acyl-CoA synthetase